MFSHRQMLVYFSCAGVLLTFATAMADTRAAAPPQSAARSLCTVEGDTVLWPCGNGAWKCTPPEGSCKCAPGSGSNCKPKGYFVQLLNSQTGTICSARFEQCERE